MAWDVSSHGLVTVMISLMNSNTELCGDTTSFVFYTSLLLEPFLYVIRSSFNNFPEFAGVIYKNHWYNYEFIKKCTLTFFVVLGKLSEGNASKNVEPAIGFSFTTKLLDTGRFRSRIS